MHFNTHSPTKVYKNMKNILKIEIHVADMFYFYFRIILFWYLLIREKNHHGEDLKYWKTAAFGNLKEASTIQSYNF